jgi:hypothetical protein
MRLLFAPPYLAEGLQAVLAHLPDPAMAGCEVRVASRLEDWPANGVARAVVVTASPQDVRSWAHCKEPGLVARLVAASNFLAGAAAAASLPGALLVSEADVRADTPGVLTRIVEFLLGASPQGWRAPAAIEDLLSATRVAAELEALKVYQRLPLAVGASAWWPAALFYSAEPGFPETIDVTGPARNLAFGPYICLTPGVWEAELEFELCAEAAQYDYPIDFGVLEDFTQCVVRPVGAGRQTASLRHTFASALPAELRLWLGRAAFHGELRLHGAKLTFVAQNAEG